jgi:hypothetical protein
MASKDKILLDTDVALNHLAGRQPFAEYAHRLFALAETVNSPFPFRLSCSATSTTFCGN